MSTQSGYIQPSLVDISTLQFLHLLQKSTCLCVILAAFSDAAVLVKALRTVLAVVTVLCDQRARGVTMLAGYQPIADVPS